MLLKKNTLSLTLLAFLLNIFSSSSEAMRDEMKEPDSNRTRASSSLSSRDIGDEEASSAVPYVIAGVVLVVVIAGVSWIWNGWNKPSQSQSLSAAPDDPQAGNHLSSDLAPHATTAVSADVTAPTYDDISRADGSHAAGSMNLTSTIDLSRASISSLSLPKDNDDLIPHFVRVLTEGSYTGISFTHTSQKLVMDFDCKDAGTMTIALFCIRPHYTASFDSECAKGSLVNKDDFPLVSSLIVGPARDAINTYHKPFSRVLNAALQVIFDRTETAHYRLSTDQRLREFVLDLSGQSGTSFTMLYGVSAPKDHPSLGKRLRAYR